MPVNLKRIKIGTATADAAGDGTATKTLYGLIRAIYVDYSASSAAGTDVTIADADGQTYLTLTNNNTDGVYYPRAFAEDTVGTDLVYSGTDKVPIKFPAYGPVTLTVAQNTEGETVTAYAYVEE